MGGSVVNAPLVRGGCLLRRSRFHKPLLFLAGHLIISWLLTQDLGGVNTVEHELVVEGVVVGGPSSKCRRRRRPRRR